MEDLSSDHRELISDLYRELGGTSPSVQFRPGHWDLAFEGGLIVELDEELHFNRYRRTTLKPEWTEALPWRNDYLRFAVKYEPACLAAARWGKRWTNPSCERLFGPADPPGTFATVGSPRWKQRALYDAMKDVAALGDSEIQLARLATFDVINGVCLDDALNGHATVDLDAFRELLAQRSA